MKKDNTSNTDDLNYTPDWSMVFLAVILSGSLVAGFFELLHSIAVATYIQ